MNDDDDDIIILHIPERVFKHQVEIEISFLAHLICIDKKQKETLHIFGGGGGSQLFLSWLAHKLRVDVYRFLILLILLFFSGAH